MDEKAKRQIEPLEIDVISSIQNKGLAKPDPEYRKIVEGLQKEITKIFEDPSRAQMRCCIQGCCVSWCCVRITLD